MSFRKEVERRLAALETQVKVFGQVVIAKDREIERLSKFNQDLMNRFMATKWEQYALNNPDHFKDMEQPLFPEYSPESDEANIGEVLTDAELRK